MAPAPGSRPAGGPTAGAPLPRAGRRQPPGPTGPTTRDTRFYLPLRAVVEHRLHRRPLRPASYAEPQLPVPALRAGDPADGRRRPGHRAPWPQTPRQWLHIGVTGLLVHGVYLGGCSWRSATACRRRASPRWWWGCSRCSPPWAPALLGEGAAAPVGGLVLGLAGVALVVSNKVAGAAGTPQLAAMLARRAGALRHHRRHAVPETLLPGLRPAHRLGDPVRADPPRHQPAWPAQTEAMAVDWNGHFVFALLWLVLVLSVGAISLLNLLIRSGSAVNVASLFYLTPPTTALIAWAVFGETLTGLALAGMWASRCSACGWPASERAGRLRHRRHAHPGHRPGPAQHRLRRHRHPRQPAALRGERGDPQRRGQPAGAPQGAILDGVRR